MKELHIDIETFSSVPIDAGVYKYASSEDFHIQLFGVAIDKGYPKIYDLTKPGERVPEEIITALNDPSITKKAHNANFEVTCLIKAGVLTDIKQWKCSMVKCLTLGLPGGLGKVADILGLEVKKKKTNLVHWFSKPYGEGKTIHRPEEYPEKWAEYKEYNFFDVIVEQELDKKLGELDMEWDLWHIDHIINNRGIDIDTDFVKCIINLDQKLKEKYITKMKEITGLENPNSLAQLKPWLIDRKCDASSLTKDRVIDLLITNLEPEVKEVLKLRQLVSKTSTAKYAKMLEMINPDNRIRNTMFFYGAHTGRWAGRGIQVQNFPKTYLNDLELFLARKAIKNGKDPTKLYGHDILSWLTRTTIIGDLSVADFSSIEARVLCWLAGETWANEIFASDGKIYEAQASKMYGIPIEDVDKDLRNKGKIATLALGYQGAVGSLEQMGWKGSDEEARNIVKLWRKSNKNIAALWKIIENSIVGILNNNAKCAKIVLKDQAYIILNIYKEDQWLKIKLPGGRCLNYYKPELINNKIHFMGVDSNTRQFKKTSTYGGRLVENIVQGIARDIMALAITKMHNKGMDILFHVHDEIICNKAVLKEMIKIMEEKINWAPGLIIRATGYNSPFYKK